MKRAHSDDDCILLNEESITKKPNPSTPNSRILKNGLFYTKVEELADASNSNAFSLYELINKINPIASIHFNFCVDPDFVLSQYPRRCRLFPITLVVGQPHGAVLQAESLKYPNVTVKTAPIPFPYGTHHTKLSIFESEDAIHLVISTANLISEDYGLKTQCFYYCRAPFITESNTSGEHSIAQLETESTTKPQENFLTDLLDYLDGAYAKTGGAPFMEYWLERIGKSGADFSAIPDRLISSRPGRFTGANLAKYGHMCLRSVLAEKFNASQLKQQKTKIVQISSIGSLGGQPQSWLCDEFLRSLCGGDTKNMNPNFLKIIYPSAENVRCSLEGYCAGGSLPYSSNVNSKQTYLRNFLCQWKSDHLARTNAMPHVKSYTALSAETEKPEWLLITSANLSHAAWGKLEKNGTQLFCRSYELGVLVCVQDHPELDTLPLPFDLPVTKYSSNDTPFLNDAIYSKSDAMGHNSFSSYYE